MTGSFSPIHLLVLPIVMLIAFAPSIVAFGRGIRQKWPVFLLNLVGGWTGIGWIAALIWAIAGKPLQVEQNYRETFR